MASIVAATDKDDEQAEKLDETQSQTEAENTED